MYTPNELEALSMAFDGQMKRLQQDVMSDIIRRIAINGEVTRSADWQINRLYEIGVTKEHIEKSIQKSMNITDEEIEAMFKQVIESGYVRNEGIYKKLGAEFIPFEENELLQQYISAIAKQTAEEMHNISQSLGFAVKNADGTLTFKPIAEYYQDTLDNAINGIASGVFDYNTALKKAVNEMTNSGLRTVDYASGWSNRVDVAARRAVMTGMSQLTGKVNQMNAKELGTDTYEVTWHSGARPSHQEWQGKWFTMDELISVCGLGTVTGLNGANCYHDYYPVIPGISVPTYTAEELEEMNRKENTPVKYGDKEYTKYEALQRQRRLETTMRAQRQKIKLLETGNADEDDIIAARCRYRGTSQEYTRFSKAMDLPQQRERVTIDGLGNIGQGKYKKQQRYLEQYKRYKERLGNTVPDTYEEFEELRNSNSLSWDELQLKYRYKGIDDRLLERARPYRVMKIEDGVPDEYNDCARNLDSRSKEVVFKYTDGGSGCAEINKYAATGITTTQTTSSDVQCLQETLEKMHLPYDTVVFRGTKREYIIGLDELEKNSPIADWKSKIIHTKAFSSTSLFRDTAYPGEVEMTILVPKDTSGAGYVNEISHHHLSKGYKDEYEVVLQNNSNYAIIEGQYYKEKLFLIVEWLGR